MQEPVTKSSKKMSSEAGDTLARQNAPMVAADERQVKRQKPTTTTAPAAAAATASPTLARSVYEETTHPLVGGNHESKPPPSAERTTSYRDYADAPLLSLDPSQVPPFLKGGRLPFPGLLHKLLQQARPLAYTHICSWQPRGRAFRIHRRDLFETVLLRKYFQGQNEYAAFHRQLNMYGFQRITNTNNSDYGSLYHERFLRGRLDLAVHIPRFPVKGTKVRRRTNQDEEPNFDEMKALPSDDEDDENGVEDNGMAAAAASSTNKADGIDYQAESKVGAMSSSRLAAPDQIHNLDSRGELEEGKEVHE